MFLLVSFHGGLYFKRESALRVGNATRDLVCFVAWLDYANSLMAHIASALAKPPIQEPRSRDYKVTCQTQCHIMPPSFAVFTSAFCDLLCPVCAVSLGMGVDDTDEGSHQQGLIWFPEESVNS